MSRPPLCPLGFTDQLVPAGSHICQIYSEDDEQLSSLLGFLESGLKNGERTACFTDKLDEEALGRHLSERGLSLDRLKETKSLTKAGGREIYLQNDAFEPERMLALLRQFYEDSVTEGFSSARVIGEMIPEVCSAHGGSRLMEYESRVSLQMRDYPVTAVCQYNANIFDGGTILQVLKVHPLLVIRGAVVHNPYFIPPVEYLRQNEAR